MNTKEIENLLEKYFEGETTLSEEKALRDFFSGRDIPPHLAGDAEMFRFFSSESELKLSDQMQEESLTRKLQQYRDEAGKTMPLYRKRKMYFMSAAAAGLLLLAGFIFVMRNEMRSGKSINVHSNTELAFNQTRQALIMVSVGLNTGMDAMNRLNTMDNAMDQIKMMNKFFDYKNQFINPDAMISPSTNQKEK